jgi:hypothetical protein
MKIGIDFSINSTAICIQSDEMKLFSFVPDYRSTLSGFKIHNKISDIVDIISYDKKSTTKDPIEDQSIKLSNADSLSNAIISTIEPFITGIPEIRIEGFSFGSKGNAFIDIITYNTFLKVKIIQKWGNCISVISPKTVKKLYTGNGNASKCDMLRTFFTKEDSIFKKRFEDLGLNREEDFNIPKPIDDLIDSVALCSIQI